MADDRYHIDMAIPDLGPAAAMFQAAKNQRAQNRRADEYAQMERDAIKARSERESAALARQKAEDDRKHAIEAWTAMPALQRAALKSVPQANTNPYGVHFDETRDLPANVEGPQASPAAEEARFAPPEPTFHPVEQPPVGSLAPGMEGPEQDPLAEAARHTMEGPQEAPRVLDPGEEGPQQEQPQAMPIHPLLQAASNAAGFTPGPEGQRRVMGRYAGQQFEVQPQSDATGLGEEYDVLYDHIMNMPGMTPGKAIAIVAAKQKADSSESGRNTRAQNQIDWRNLNREDQQTFIALQNKLYKNEPLTNAEREKLASMHASAGASFKQEGVNDRIFSLLDRRAKAVRDTGLFGKLAANDKVVRGIMANLSNGTEGLQHKDAQIQLARYFRQAQPTEGEMHLLYDKLGGWTDSFNQFKAKVLRGDLSPEQLRQMKNSARTVLREHEEDKKRFYQVARSGLGPGSGLDEIPDQAQKAFDMMAAELGIEPGQLAPLYETEGGVTLGTKKAPKTQPRGAKKSPLDEVESMLDAMGTK